MRWQAICWLQGHRSGNPRLHQQNVAFQFLGVGQHWHFASHVCLKCARMHQPHGKICGWHQHIGTLFCLAVGNCVFTVPNPPSNAILKTDICHITCDLWNCLVAHLADFCFGNPQTNNPNSIPLKNSVHQTGGFHFNGKGKICACKMNLE